VEIVKFVLITHYSIICKLNTNLTTFDNLLAAFVYPIFRSQHPDEATLKEVLKELQENNIDDRQFVETSAVHCQWAESSTARGSSA